MSPPAPRYSDEELLDDVRRVAAMDETATPPTKAEYREHGIVSVQTQRRRFGGRWSDVHRAAGFEPRSAPNNGGAATAKYADAEWDDLSLASDPGGESA